MRFSIITVTKNNKAGLLRAIECVRNQTYKDVEHIVVDGGSTDGSGDILRSKQKEINKGPVIPANEVRQESTADSGLRRNDTNSKKTEPLTSNLPTGQAGYQLLTTNYSLLTISEPDEGIYDAINKGIKLATGDVIGLLHSDDLYADENVLEKYADSFNQPTTTNQQPPIIDAVYSDLVYVRKKQEARSQELESDSGPVFTSFRQGKQARMTETKTSHYSLLTTHYSTIRYWKTHVEKLDSGSSSGMTASGHRSLVTDHLLKNGWMPPHPTLFIRKEVFEKYGYYSTDMKIAADYEMILRLLYKHKITS
ncbi:MAG: glycosyltransferase, partial [Ignavibacteriaceae bacterium]|nr:glycosyltransferase [Ignavibacteriaceae bacterium]